MQLHKNIAISESGFIFNPATGDSFSVNPIGAEILHLLSSNIKPTEIVKTLIEKYDIDQSTLEKDMDDFLVNLKENSIVSNE